MHSNRNSFKLRTVVLFSSEHARRVTVNWKLCKLEGWTRRNWEEGASIAHASARATDLRRRRTASRLVVFSKPQRWAMLRNTTKAWNSTCYVLQEKKQQRKYLIEISSLNKTQKITKRKKDRNHANPFITCISSIYQALKYYRAWTACDLRWSIRLQCQKGALAWAESQAGKAI